MAIFNQSFFDLNNKRCYCLVTPDEEFPLELVSDLKVSVPNFTEQPCLRSIFIRDNSIRLTVSVDNRLALSYSSDNRNSVRLGQPYPFKSYLEGYEGMIVFGAGIKSDCEYVKSSLISEECITRYLPSRIPYVSLTCIKERLVGDIILSGGDLSIAYTDKVAVSGQVFPNAEEALQLDLVDTSFVSSENPMIRLANGVNAYNEVAKRSPVYSVGGIYPDATGTVTIMFEDHFRITPIVEPDVTDVITCVAVGSDIIQSDVCFPSRPSDGDGSGDENLCDVGEITFETIMYK
jgi:hypothetical protein